MPADRLRDGSASGCQRHRIVVVGQVLSYAHADPSHYTHLLQFRPHLLRDKQAVHRIETR